MLNFGTHLHFNVPDMFGHLWAETPFPRANVVQQERHRDT